MHSLISATLLLAASVAALPSADLPTRADRCGNVKKWTVKNFDYHADYTFTTPAHQNSWGYASFTLVHPLLDYKVKCSAASSQLEDFFYGNVEYDCKLPKGAPSSDAASFKFNYPTGKLNIEQSWLCDDNGARYTANGGVKLDLECKEKKWENPKWHEGDIYSQRTVTCKKVNVKAPVKRISAVLRESQ